MTVSYSFEHNVMKNQGGKKVRINQSIVDGDKGVTVRFLSKTDNDKDFKKVRAMEKDGKMTVTTKKGEGEEKNEEMTLEEFLKMAKADKDLDFVVEYMKKRILGGVKRSVRKSSKKTSRKGSKKTSKSGGAKRVRKSSKKTSRKSSKKTSRK